MATNPQPASQKELKLLNGKFQQLLAKVAENRPTDDLEIIRKAYDFSLKHHQGQTRASERRFIMNSPTALAYRLATAGAGRLNRNLHAPGCMGAIFMVMVP